MVKEIGLMEWEEFSWYRVYQASDQGFEVCSAVCEILQNEVEKIMVLPQDGNHNLGRILGDIEDILQDDKLHIIDDIENLINENLKIEFKLKGYNGVISYTELYDELEIEDPMEWLEVLFGFTKPVRPPQQTNEKEQEKTVEYELVIKFAYFTANFPRDFVERVWEGESYLIDHINAKLKSLVSIDTGTFMNFFFDLDKRNQVKLIEWIDKNYKN